MLSIRQWHKFVLSTCHSLASIISPLVTGQHKSQALQLEVVLNYYLRMARVKEKVIRVAPRSKVVFNGDRYLTLGIFT